MLIDTIALVLTIIGAINWLLVGVFQFDIVAWLFGGQGAILSRILYTIIGAAGVWCITLLFQNNKVFGPAAKGPTIGGDEFSPERMKCHEQ